MDGEKRPEEQSVSRTAIVVILLKLKEVAPHAESVGADIDSVLTPAGTVETTFWVKVKFAEKKALGFSFESFEDALTKCLKEFPTPMTEEQRERKSKAQALRDQAEAIERGDA